MGTVAAEVAEARALRAEDRDEMPRQAEYLEEAASQSRTSREESTGAIIQELILKAQETSHKYQQLK